MKYDPKAVLELARVIARSAADRLFEETLADGTCKWDPCPYGQKNCPGGAACTCALPSARSAK